MCWVLLSSGQVRLRVEQGGLENVPKVRGEGRPKLGPVRPRKVRFLTNIGSAGTIWCPNSSPQCRTVPLAPIFTQIRTLGGGFRTNLGDPPSDPGPRSPSEGLLSSLPPDVPKTCGNHSVISPGSYCRAILGQRQSVRAESGAAERQPSWVMFECFVTASADP